MQIKKIILYLWKNIYLPFLSKIGVKSPELFRLTIFKLFKDFYVLGSLKDYWIQNHLEYYKKNNIKICLDNQFNEGIFSIYGEKYELLIKNLDNESKKVVDLTIYSIYITGINYKLNNTFFTLIDRKDKYELLQKENKKEKGINYYKKHFGVLSYNHYEDNVFYYWSGLRYIKDEISFDLFGKDIIDCGAFIGDSALVFNKIFKYNKIYAIEPTKQNYVNLLKTLQINNLQDKVVPLKLGVGNKQDRIIIKYSGVGSSIVNEFINDIGEEIEIDTIDNLVEKYNIKPGVIKWDIEGYELESVKGAENTIKKYKPILLISIYHTGKDFFEIKPLIESWNLGYKFKIVDCNPMGMFEETVLICY